MKAFENVKKYSKGVDNLFIFRYNCIEVLGEVFLRAERAPALMPDRKPERESF